MLCSRTIHKSDTLGHQQHRPTDQHRAARETRIPLSYQHYRRPRNLTLPTNGNHHSLPTKPPARSDQQRSPNTNARTAQSDVSRSSTSRPGRDGRGRNQRDHAGSSRFIENPLRPTLFNWCRNLSRLSPYRQYSGRRLRAGQMEFSVFDRTRRPTRYLVERVVLVVDSPDVRSLPLAPRNPLPYWQQLKALKTLHVGSEALRDAGGGDSHLVGSQTARTTNGHGHFTPRGSRRLGALRCVVGPRNAATLEGSASRHRRERAEPPARHLASTKAHTAAAIHQAARRRICWTHVRGSQSHTPGMA
ncbi:hypothetical protein DE4576_03129 [Mycobacterium marinum]|nr:hypothetical protein DE4576_03129 [Mycobacterium marinum]